MSKIDRMGIMRSDDVSDNTRYRSLYMVKQRHNNVNDYGGNSEDVELLDNITNAAAGSTCLFTNGDIYRLELDGWAKFGEDETELNASQASTASVSPTVTPLNIDRNALTGSVDIGGGQTVETLDFEPETMEKITADDGEEVILEAPEEQEETAVDNGEGEMR